MRARGFGHEGKWVFIDASPAKAGVGGYRILILMIFAYVVSVVAPIGELRLMIF